MSDAIVQQEQVKITAANHVRHSFAEDVRRGLTREPKVLYPKYFYDERGSRLFEKICKLPEYYQTRTERKILDRVSPEIVRKYRPTTLIEYGAGAATKTRILLDAMRKDNTLERYVPIDVSSEFLTSVADRLSADYPELQVHGLTGDFLEPIDLPYRQEPRIIAFLGSTIGNLNDAETDDFLHLLTAQMTENDVFLLGTDLVKDTDALEAAYDDSQDVTAEFNKNMLRRINRELDGGFDLNAFEHVAVYNEEEAQIEIYLKSLEEQTVTIGALDLDVHFERDETLRTEISCKYDKARVTRLLRQSGLVITDWFTDPREYFAVSISRLMPGDAIQLNGSHEEQ